jgi:hypothetical protein
MGRSIPQKKCIFTIRIHLLERKETSEKFMISKVFLGE